MSLDASIGSLTANCYVTVEEADAYFLERAHSSTWENSQKEQLLITASRILDWQLKFQGVKTLDIQSMQFPRKWVILANEYLVPDNIIPVAVKQATFELAFSFISGDRTSDSALSGIEQVKAGPLFVKAVAGGVNDTSPKVVPDYIKRILSEYIVSGSMGVVWLLRA